MRADKAQRGLPHNVDDQAVTAAQSQTLAERANTARRRGLQTSMRRTPGIGTGAGRRGVTPRLSFRLIHSCS